MEPFVSVIIPCYNTEKTIVRTLNSIDKCGYENLEIITVNDGSTDNTGNILDAAANIDRRIKVVHQRNSGVSAARNIGVFHASSEYVTFLDADDVFFEGSISARMKVFTEDDDEDLLGVFCPALLLDEGLNLLCRASMFDYELPMDRLYFSAYAGSVFNPSCVIVKKTKFVAAGGFDPALPTAEDYDMWQKMMRMGGYFRKTTACLVGWVQHESSATHANMLNHYRNKKLVISRLFSESRHESVAIENTGGLGVCYYNDAVSRTALQDALNAAIAGCINEAVEISNDITTSYLDRLQFGEFNNQLEFCSIKTLCQPETCWPFPLWNKIRTNVYELLTHLSYKDKKKNGNILSILEKLRNYDIHDPAAVKLPEKDEPASLQDSIEILSPDLIDADLDLAQAILQRGKELNIGLGWHYIVDLIWIIKNVLRLPKGSLILDAGAGNGLLQFLLSDLGYTVISADFAARTAPPGTHRSHRVIGISTGKEYENEYIQHLEAEFRTKSSGSEQYIQDADKFDQLLDSSPPGTIFYYRSDICSLQLLMDGKVDAVVSLSALEHNRNEDFQKAVKELCRVLKPDGMLLATVSATDKTEDWYHTESKGWCYTEDSLKRLFSLMTPVSNFNNYTEIFSKLRQSVFLKQNLAQTYFNSGNNGMPWGVWNPRYQPVGIRKIHRRISGIAFNTNGSQSKTRLPVNPDHLHTVLQGGKLSALIDTTDGCNLRCSFCSRENSKIEMMTTENFRLLMGKIRPYVDNVQLCCAWEYSIAPNAHELVRLLGDYRFSKTTIYTNGQILPDILARSIIEAGVNNLVFSIGESKNETYEKLRRGGKFDKLLENIAKIRDLKLNTGADFPTLCANLTVINSNISELPDFVDLAHKLGIAEIRGRHLILNDGLDMNGEVIRNTGHANAILDIAESKAKALGIKFNIPRYADTADRKDCQAPWRQLYIGSNGDVSVCPRIHKYVVIGNILKQEMRQILTSPEISSMQNQMKERRFSNPVCGICEQNLETLQPINQGF